MAQFALIRQRLKHTSTLNTLKSRITLLDVLREEKSGPKSNLNRSIIVLEKILHKRRLDTSTPEIAIAIARFQTKAGHLNEARRILEGVEPFINKELSKEFSGEWRRPFRDEARRALKQLKKVSGSVESSKPDDVGGAQFRRAEKLRDAEKWRQAIPAYQNVIEKFPETDYATRSRLHIGHCYLGMRRFDFAVEQWKEFIRSAPAGPWRGQAYVALIDLLLERNLDLDGAGRYARSAEASLAEALGKSGVSSWHRVAFDVYLRGGIVALLRGNNQRAVARFKAAQNSEKAPKVSHAGLRRLIAVAEEGSPLIPPELISKQQSAQGVVESGQEDVESNQASTALLLAVLYRLTRQKEHALAVVARLLPPSQRPGTYRRVTPVGGITLPHRAFAAYLLGMIRTDAGSVDTALQSVTAAIRNAEGLCWLDAASYLAAVLIERRAKREFGLMKDKSVDSKRISPSATARDTQLERERHRKECAARSAALPFLYGNISAICSKNSCTQIRNSENSDLRHVQNHVMRSAWMILPPRTIKHN